ncbi:hypothetical protein BLOT_008637 [Blomia tropicalis]|nr:hypothetical protein BLOT_008637 [Blomia tropicalis]
MDNPKPSTSQQSNEPIQLVKIVDKNKTMFESHWRPPYPYIAHPEWLKSHNLNEQPIIVEDVSICLNKFPQWLQEMYKSEVLDTPVNTRSEFPRYEDTVANKRGLVPRTLINLIELRRSCLESTKAISPENVAPKKKQTKCEALHAALAAKNAQEIEMRSKNKKNKDPLGWKTIKRALPTKYFPKGVPNSNVQYPDFEDPKFLKLLDVYNYDYFKQKGGFDTERDTMSEINKWFSNENNSTKTTEPKPEKKEYVYLEEYFYGELNDPHHEPMESQPMTISDLSLKKVPFVDLSWDIMNIIWTNEKVPLTCLHCLQQFPTTSMLLEHINTVSNPYEPYCCMICMVRFSSENERAHHLKKFHLKNRLPYSCSECSFRCSLQTQYYSHIKQFHPIAYCQYCHKPFYDIMADADEEQHELFNDDSEFCTQIESHLYAHLKVLDDFKCPYCLLSFLCKLDLVNHKITEHNDTYHAYFCLDHYKKFELKVEEKLVAIKYDSLDEIDHLIPCPDYPRLRVHPCLSGKINPDTILVEARCLECNHKGIEFNHYNLIDPLKCSYCGFQTYCRETYYRHLKNSHNHYLTTLIDEDGPEIEVIEFGSEIDLD